LAVKVVERLERQVELVRGLVEELRVESSYRGVERLVQAVIQALLDLGFMAISALRGRRPSSYSEVGVILYELGVLSRDYAELLRTMAGLRNILVHMYASVDREKVLEASKRLIHDAPVISNAILEAIRSRGVNLLKRLDLDLEPLVSRLRGVLGGKVELAYLFGGRAKGYVLKGDYDIAVLMPNNYTLYDLGLLQVDIAEALAVSEEEVDLVCLNSAPPELVLEALNGIPIIENPVKRLELEARALRELLDTRESARLASKITEYRGIL